jgi:hypothetical protein
MIRSPPVVLPTAAAEKLADLESQRDQVLGAEIEAQAERWRGGK